MEDSKVETVTEEIATTVYQFRKRKLNNSSAVMEGKRFQHKVYYRQKSTISYSSVHSNNEDVKIKEPSTKRTLLSIETEEMARPQSSTPKKEVFVHKDVLWQRKWLSFNKHHLPPKYESFKVVSYNILSEEGSKISHLYPYAKEEDLKWTQRLPKLVKELSELNADVVCLQEVDHYEQLCDGLSGYGYTGVYKQRTGSFRDGCAIFWKQERFNLIKHVLVEYNMSGKRGCEWINRDNVGVICVLQYKRKNDNESKESEGPKICISTTHLLFNPKQGAIKLAQLKILFEEVERLLQSFKGEHIPFILTGDLNLTPRSKIHEFLMNGSVDLYGMDVTKASGQRFNERPYIIPEHVISQLTGTESTIMKHKFKFKSCYSPEGLISTVHTEFVGNVDYILYTPGLSCIGILSLPNYKVWKTGQLGIGLPNQRFASDHFSLMAEFVFDENMTGNQNSKASNSHSNTRTFEKNGVNS